MSKSIWTWLLAAWPWTLWGFIFKSIIFVSVSAWPSSLASRTGDSRWWFCWLSSTVTLCGGGWLCTLPISLGTLECGDGSSRFIGLSPGNWKRIRTSKFQSKNIWKIREVISQSINQPQPSAVAKGISYVSFSLQHERSCHIANKGNFHLSHSKRKLHTISKAKNKIYLS